MNLNKTKLKKALAYAIVLVLASLMMSSVQLLLDIFWACF